jgi:CheY-like chemotaxis protein
MRAVVFTDKLVERDAIGRMLLRAAFQVEAPADVKSAIATISREPTHVIFFSWPSAGGCELVQLLRGADASSQAYVVAIVEATSAARDIAAAVNVGVHDVVRRPIVEEELLVRAQAPARLAAWAKALAKGSTLELAGGLDLRRLRAWTDMGSIVAEDFAQLFGEGLEAVEGWPKRFGKTVRAATIPMSLSSAQMEVRVSIVTDPASLTFFGGVLLGDPAAAQSSLDDLLRELANTAGGAVKRAALPDKVVLTTGIPVNDPSIRASGEGIRSWAIPVARGKGYVAIVGELRRRENLRVPTSELAEGMVLVHDLCNESGALIIPAGTRLTSSTAERMSQMFGRKFVIEVAHAT